jgi:LemA protein
MTYNVRVETFPVNLVAGAFNFQRRDLFEVKAEAERAAPKVSF